jgi:ankyrin repeat protein
MKRTFELTVKNENNSVNSDVNIVLYEEPVVKKTKHWSSLHLMACLGELSDSSEDELNDVSKTDRTSYLRELQSINEQDFNGCTPLLWAVSEGNLSTAETLIDCGADVNSQNFYGETALFLASSRGHQSICQLLLESGANPNFPNSDGVYPIHMAVASGFYDIVTLLCAHGAFMNVKDDAGDTLLHYAVR